MGPGLKTGGVVGPGLKAGDVEGSGLKRGVAGLKIGGSGFKNSTD